MLINLRNALMAGKRLPYDNEIEFLESTGTQWIGTGVIGKPDTVADISFRWVGNQSGDAVILGCRNNSISAPRFVMLMTNQTKVRQLGVGGDWVTNGHYDMDTDYNSVSSFASSLTTQKLDGVTIISSTRAIADTGVNLALFGNNVNGNTVNIPKARVYHAKIYQNGVLVRDYIPVRVGTVGYLYDRVSGKLFGNAGTGDFVLGPDVVPVEWLESGANTYINTGIIPDDTYGMEVTGYTTQTNDSAWIGTRNSSAQRCFMGYSPPLGFYYGWNGRQDIQYTTGVWSTASMNLYNSRKNMMDGTEVGSIAETLGAQNRAIYLFGLTANGTLGLKLKSALITKGSGDVQKLVSVRIGTDATSWEGAMMDTLTRRVYRNAGTGAFTYGNDLKYPIPAA